MNQGHANLASSFSAVLTQRAAERPEALAYRFVEANGDALDITYGELDRRAGAIAARLREHMNVGDRALLLNPPGLDNLVALFACFHAGVVAVPAYPPDPRRLDRTLPRLLNILRDAQVSAVLCPSSMATAAAPLRAAVPEFKSLPWILVDDVSGGGHVAEDSLEHSHPALLQYTSGSTSRPKGVVLSHGNLLHDSDCIRRAFGHTTDSRVVIWLPPFHDMGLIGGILQPMFMGIPVALLSPLTILRNPLMWLQTVSNFKATTTGGPDFGYRLCVRRFRPERCEGMDLSRWDVAFNGAEPIRANTLRDFTRTFAPYGFRHETHYPCYGLAEGTLLVTGGRKQDAPVELTLSSAGLEQGEARAPHEGEATSELVGSGKTAHQQDLRVVHPDTREPLPDGRVGELWLAGSIVGQGYWNNPAVTQQVFNATLSTGEGPFLRTGDLGFFREGELFVTGRIKDLMIFRGRNVHPHDVERCAEAAHPELRPGCSAAFSVTEGSEDRLVLVAELRDDFEGDRDALVMAIRQSVNKGVDLQLSALCLLKSRSVHKTSSGKIQRSMCKRSFLKGKLEQVHSWSMLSGPLQ